MKPFRFNLEKVLRIREHETMLAKNNLALAMHEAEKAREALEQATNQRKAFEAEMTERMKHRMTAQQLSFTTMQHETFMEAEEIAEEGLRQALDVVSTRREELAEAERRQKTLEKLQDRQYRDWQYEAGVEEQNLIDEMAQNQMRRSREGGGL